MKKILFSLFFSIICLSFASAQDAQKVYERRGSGMFVEILGNGVLYSLNYESRLSNQNRGLGARVGFAFGRSEGDTRLSIPVMMNYLLGKPEGKHFFEIGAGVTYISLEGATVSVNDEEVIFNSKVYGTFSFMYHLHPPYGGFMWKIGFTPLVGDFEDRSFLGWVGIGLGYAF